jgi:uncharacterized membrane protein YphA (DoxX/SURF4 family)
MRGNMDDSIAHPSFAPGAVESPAWKTYLSTASALLLGALMLVAGVWKCSDPIAAAVRLHQALVPAALSLPAALALGISEAFAGVLLVVPRFRRWGAWLSVLLLVAFLLYIGINYTALRGEECNCFPWIERAVGPAFFIGDLVMLALAVFAWRWAPPSEGKRGAGIVLGAVCVFAFASYGMHVVKIGTVRAPDSILVAGQPVSLHEGRVFLYFFDPECTHCFFAAKEMAGYRWKNIRIIAVPTARGEFASQFLDGAGWNAAISTDVEKLRQSFSFGDPPYAVALENGRLIAAIAIFEGEEPRATLKRTGFIE